MENPSYEYLPKIKDYLKMAAHWAMIMSVVICLRLFMTIYYVYNHYSSLSGSASTNLQSYTYLGNSIIDVILSSLSAIFLYKFAQYAYQNGRVDTSLDGEGLFANFRNYLIISIVLSLNWLVFTAINLLGRFF